MAFLGGLGTIVGPLLGALVLESLQQYLTQTFSSNGTYLIAYGVLFLAVILLLPRGVVPGIAELAARAGACTRGQRSPADEREATVPRRRRGGGAMSNLIEVQGVSKAYGGVQALSVCDLEVREGEINGLIGPNGSGKTTLFNVITGYERIQQGEVRFNGQRDHQRPAGPRVQARHRAHVPADPAVHAPDRAREHARRHPAQGGLAARRAAPCRARPARSAARWSCWTSSASRGSPTSRPATSPTASASCSSSPRCWSPTRPSCCSTSRPAASTRR